MHEGRWREGKSVGGGAGWTLELEKWGQRILLDFKKVSIRIFIVLA